MRLHKRQVYSLATEKITLNNDQSGKRRHSVTSLRSSDETFSIFTPSPVVLVLSVTYLLFLMTNTLHLVVPFPTIYLALATALKPNEVLILFVLTDRVPWVGQILPQRKCRLQADWNLIPRLNYNLLNFHLLLLIV